MHEKNIALLCDEADRLLQLNINLLRQMVDEPDVLSDSKNENGLLFDKRKALKRIEELEGEQIKTARREMVLAVVGTMKAGKSTTINAIVGQEILPNRNRPMTSVPTLIRHVPGKTEPVLHLEHIQPVRNLLITLQEKLAPPAGQQVAQTLLQTGDTRELLDILTDDGWLKNEYHGEEEIFTGLASLNDLVRLAAAMGSEFPFDEYAEVQKLPVIDVEFSHLVGMDACQGTLTLLDTPGPNEAGQPQMEVMMRDQLQKASAVLAVMDYTQMNSKADEDVRKELNAIADVSVGRLFVLVNKFDEKDRNGDGADAVRQKVPAMLNSDVLPASRVYPGSSRQAYLANRALHELRKNGTLPVDEAWVDDFVREAFGRMKKDYVCKDSELATEGATDLWEGSLIDQLITEVIQSSHSRAAALAVDSAAAKLMQNAENVSEYLSLRHQGLQQSIQSLQAHITSLLADIREIADCQEQVPLYVSLYPTEGGVQDIIDCIRAELGAGTTKNSVFQHIQSLPRGQQKEALLASAALPLLFRPREVQGKMYGDGGMGGWQNMQGNTPVTPLVDAGCNMVIVSHLSDGSLWDRRAFPDTTILEIRPRKKLKQTGEEGKSGGLLSFTSAHTDTWRQQGYEDTMLTMEHIRKPLAARQALTRSEAVLQKSLDITEEADLALRNAMARIK
ncbi:dynamin family protein [Escherichia coli]|nr:dynamin family protein [Escherichia coli]